MPHLPLGVHFEPFKVDLFAGMHRVFMPSIPIYRYLHELKCRSAFYSEQIVRIRYYK